MTDTTETPAAEATKKTRRLNAKSVKRRVGRIAATTEPKVQRKKKGKLAVSILEKIASGEIKNPKAVAQAFVAGQIAEETAGTEEEAGAA